jgi:hypothetical protein
VFWALPLGAVVVVWLAGVAAGAAFVVGSLLGGAMVLLSCAHSMSVGLFEARKGEEPIDETFIRMLERLPRDQAEACVGRLARARAFEAVRPAGRVS